MLRKLGLLAVLAVSAFAVMAPSAFAEEEDDVIVHNPGMFTLSGNQLAIVAHVGGGVEVPLLQCTNSWEANVDAAGGIDLHDVNLDPPGTDNCASADDCDNGGWSGEFEEAQHVDEEAGELTEFVAHVTFCISGSGLPIDGVTGHVECDVDEVPPPDTDLGDEAHCDVPLGGGLEVQGEIDIASDADGSGVDLEHAR